VDDSIPGYIFAQIPPAYYIKVEVAEYRKARLYFDQKLVRILDAGTYYFWRTSTKVDVGFVDTRLTQMNITGQEILTADKVSLRINFVCNYRVTDYVKILTEIDDFAEQMHVAAQLALREYVGKHKLDEILENKDQMSEFVFAKLKSKEKDLFVEITDAGVKDIILPGEIREIMNTVLVAEKRAQANVITRREEVASTRSLLNTAKLMDENQTLYKLKELEYVERICENVGNISLNGNGNILSQITAILGAK
jgi:regulator of protease activity HflC (stomatin/prohibitin superfamily)